MDIFKPIMDKDLRLWIDQARDIFNNLQIREQIIGLAKYQKMLNVK